jgi:hypothetical protein
LENSPNNLTNNLAAGAETAQMWQADLPSGSVIVSKPSARPLWLSTVGYTLIALAVSAAIFLIILGLLHDGTEREGSWIPAGIAAFSVLFIAIIAREVVLRRAQTRYLLKKDTFGQPLPALRPKAKVKSKKFSLEQNAAALSLIQQKSDEANSSVATAEKHLEVFKACQASCKKFT